MNDPEAGSFLHKRFPESRSRRLKDCVHRGLGRSLNKQKTIRSTKVEWMVFRICNTDALLAIMTYEKSILQIRLEIYLNNPIISWFYIAKFYLKRYNVKVSTSSQIRLQMVHRNVGGIVSSDMDDFVCGTCLPPSDSICIYITHFRSWHELQVCVSMRCYSVETI